MKIIAAALLLAFSYSFLNYWQLSKQSYSGELTSYHEDMLTGSTPAPLQYRILPILCAEYMKQHIPGIGIRHAYAILDGASAVLAILLISSLIAGDASKAIGLGLMCFYLFWTMTWFQKSETLPSVATASLLIFVMVKTRGEGGRSILIIFLVIVQSFLRADIAFALSCTVLTYGLLTKRLVCCITGFTGIISSITIQVWLARFVYPIAHYAVQSFQFVLNFTEPIRLIPFLLFMFPIIWTGIKYMPLRNSPLTTSVLVGSVIHFTAWITFGILSEVRIFLPFAFLLCPATTEMLWRKILHDQKKSGDL